MIVVLKKYSYAEWAEIAGKNNARRAEHGISLWTDNESWELWKAIFLS